MVCLLPNVSQRSFSFFPFFWFKLHGRYILSQYCILIFWFNTPIHLYIGDHSWTTSKEKMIFCQNEDKIGLKVAESKWHIHNFCFRYREINFYIAFIKKKKKNLYSLDSLLYMFLFWLNLIFSILNVKQIM